MWGLSWPVAKILVTGAPPFLVGFFRFISASFAFLLVYYFRRHSINFELIKSKFPEFVLLGLFGIFGYGVFFLVGLQFTTSAQGAIIAGINPAMITLFSILLNKEKLPFKWQYMGLLVSFIGVIFVIGINSILNYNPDHLLGNLLILTAMICWGCYSAIGARTMKNVSSFISTSMAVLVGMVFFGISSVMENKWNSLKDQTITFYLGVGYLGLIVTFIGFFFYFNAIKDIGATKSGIFINLVPIFGTIFSFLILGETVHWTFFIGLGLIIAGIWIINSSELVK